MREGGRPKRNRLDATARPRRLPFSTHQDFLTPPTSHFPPSHPTFITVHFHPSSHSLNPPRLLIASQLVARSSQSLGRKRAPSGSSSRSIFDFHKLARCVDPVRRYEKPSLFVQNDEGELERERERNEDQSCSGVFCLIFNLTFIS